MATCGCIIDINIFNETSLLWNIPTDLPNGVSVYNIEDLWLSFIVKGGYNWKNKRSFLPPSDDINKSSEESNKQCLFTSLKKEKQMLFNYLIEKYNTNKNNNNNNNNNIIVRILNNPLDIKDTIQIYRNLEFIIENESNFTNTDKLFILNKIQNEMLVNNIKLLLKSNNIKYIEFPLDKTSMPLLDISSENKLIMLINKYSKDEFVRDDYNYMKTITEKINKFFFDINKCRNYCIKYCKQNNYDLFFILDSCLFFTDNQYMNIIDNVNKNTKYIIIPQIKLSELNLDNNNISDKINTSIYFEEQIAFTRCSSYMFNEVIQYNSGDKKKLVSIIKKTDDYQQLSSIYKLNAKLSVKEEVELYIKEHKRFYISTIIYK